MREKLDAALAAARRATQGASSSVRAHRFWVQCAAVALVGVLAAFLVGYSALGRATALEARAAELKRAEDGLDRWRTGLRRPTAQESLSWRQSDLTLLSLDAAAARALPVARLVAQRAGEVGITGLRVKLLGEDSIAQVEPLESGGWTVTPTGEGLSVEFDGDVGGVIGLLGALPPQAALTSVELADRNGVPHARLLLVTRRATLTPRQPVAAGTPTAEELDSLSRYLAPAQPAARLDDYAVFLPARRPARFVPVEPALAEDSSTAAWELSAIMIAGARPVAIINDQPFAAGARLPDGAVVLQIERDHVVIRTPNGARRRLVLAG